MLVRKVDRCIIHFSRPLLFCHSGKKQRKGRSGSGVKPRRQANEEARQGKRRGKATREYAIVRGHTNDELPKEATGEGLSEGCVSIHAVQICYYACLAGTESMWERVCSRDDPPAGNNLVRIVDKYSPIHKGIK